MWPLPCLQKENNLCLRCVGVSPAALLCSAGSCVWTLCPVWCGKVLQTRCTLTRESSAVGALRGPGELRGKEKKKPRSDSTNSLNHSALLAALFIQYLNNIQTALNCEITLRIQCCMVNTHNTPSAADVIVPSLSTLISASSSNSWVCPDSLRSRLRRCHTLTPLVNNCHYRKKTKESYSKLPKSQTKSTSTSHLLFMMKFQMVMRSSTCMRWLQYCRWMTIATSRFSFPVVRGRGLPATLLPTPVSSVRASLRWPLASGCWPLKQENTQSHHWVAAASHRNLLHLK